MSGVLESLAEELGVELEGLRETLLATGDEALSPTYLTTDTAGRVSAQFSGHVQASGLDLAEGITASGSQEPPPENRIRWIRQADGAVTAELYDTRYDLGGGVFADQQVSTSNRQGDSQSWNVLRATDESDGSWGQIFAYNNGGGNRGVVASTSDAGSSRLVVNGAGESDYLFRADQLGWGINQGVLAGFASFVFNVIEDGTYLIIISATGYASAANAYGLLGCGIDAYDTECQLYFNQAGVHMVLNPAIYTKQLAGGSHELITRNDSNLVVDGGDRISCAGIRIGN